MIIWKNKLQEKAFNMIITFAVLWLFTTFPTFIMWSLFGWDF